MASEVFARGDVLANRGTPLIDSGNDLASNNVGGQKIFLPFGRLNVTTNLTAVVVPPLGGNATLTEVLMDRPGSIIGLAVRANAAITVGSMTLFATLDGTTKMTATLNTTDQATTVNQVKDTDAFSALGRIGVKITSATDLSPATTDIIVSVVCEI